MTDLERQLLLQAWESATKSAWFAEETLRALAQLNSNETTETGAAGEPNAGG